MEFPGLLSVFLALGAAFIWGIGDFAGGLGSRRASVYRFVWSAELLGAVALLPVAWLAGEPLPPFWALAYGVAAGVLGTFGILILFRALAQGQMSIAAPVSALLTALIPVLVGTWMDGFPGWLKIAGFGLALVAIWLISMDGDSAGVQAHLSRVALPLISGAAFGFYFVALHSAGQEGTFWPLAAARWTAVILLTVYLLARLANPYCWNALPGAWQ